MKNAAHSSSSLVPLVWIVYAARWPGRRYRSTSSTERRKNSSTHQRRLATLPRDLHDRDARVGLDQLTDVGLEQLIRHPEAAARIQHLLGEEEAVGAVEVANGAGRLREQVKGRRALGTQRGHQPSSARRQIDGTSRRCPTRVDVSGSRNIRITMLDRVSPRRTARRSSCRSCRSSRRSPRSSRRSRADHLAGRRLLPRRWRYRDGGRSRDGSPTEHARCTDPTSA